MLNLILETNTEVYSYFDSDFGFCCLSLKYHVFDDYLDGITSIRDALSDLGYKTLSGFVGDKATHAKTISSIYDLRYSQFL